MHDQFFEQLKRDHNEVKGLLTQMIDKGNFSKRSELKKQLEKALVPHMKAEESVFYPILKGKKDSRDLALEAIEEHHAAELILDEVLNLRPESEVWTAKCTVLTEMITHHIYDEENKVFKAARDCIDHDQMADILSDFASEKIWFTERITGI
jgi:hemerythrin superfamily protein